MRSISQTHPELVREWDPNNKLDPSVISAGSSLKFWWQCSKGHKWYSSVYNRTRKNGSNCPYCSHGKLSPDGSNSLAFELPKLAELWHPTKNGDLRADQIVAGGGKKHFWKCPKGYDHEWEASIHEILSSTKRYNGNGCPICRGLKVVKSNCLASLFPEIAKEWIECISHPNKTPETSTKSSNAVVRWQCKIDSRHIWITTVNNRTYSGDSCPMCSGKLNKSEPELIILFELKSIFSNIDPTAGEITRKNKEYNTKSAWFVDILIPFRDAPLIIEYDGEYAHKTKYRDNDVRKTSELKTLGFNVIRLREGSLPKIDEDWDIVFPKLSRKLLSRRIEIKRVTDELLKRILEKYGSSLTGINKISIKNYLNRKDLINIDLKEEFVQETLKEKVRQRESKKNKHRTLRPFEKARYFVRSLKLMSVSQWRLYARDKRPGLPKKPNDIPSYPELVYKDLGWIDFQDWLGFEKHDWVDFNNAKDWIKKLNLKREAEWRRYLKGAYPDKPTLPINIPRTPYKVYKTEWKGIRDWLGIQ